MYTNRNNLLLGFHGCDAAVRDALLKRPNVIQKSEKPYDWLGHGIYFWENNIERALQWARDKAKRGEIKKPAVIGAIISLDYCLDFLDSRFIDMIGAYHELMADNYEEINQKMPENKDSRHDIHKDKILRELDCSVIEFMHQAIRTQILADQKEKGFSTFKRFDSARGVFTEGGPAFTGAGIQLKNHIQICVRNTNCIKGFFLPRSESEFVI